MRTRNMHSGADVEAFTAALNRDIGGDASAAPLPSETGRSTAFCVSNTANKLFEKWQSSNHGESHGQMMQQHERQCLPAIEKHPSPMEPAHHEPGIDEINKQVGNVTKSDDALLQTKPSHPNQIQHAEVNCTSEKHQGDNPEQNSIAPTNQERTQLSKQPQQCQSQDLGGQQASASRMKPASPSIPFHMLIPILRPHLDGDRSMQLQTAFNKLRSNEVSKEDFLRVIRNIVGDQMLRQAAQKVQTQLQAQEMKNSQANSNQFSAQVQGTSQQLSSRATHQSTESSAVSSLHNNASALQNSNAQRMHLQQQIQTQHHSESSLAKLHDIGNKADGKAVPVQTLPTNLNVKPDRETPVSAHMVSKQHPQFAHSPFSMYHSLPYPRPSTTVATPAMRSLVQDSQFRPMLSAQSGSTQPSNTANASQFEQPNTRNESRRPQMGSFPHFMNHSMQQRSSGPWQQSTTKEHKNSAFPPVANVKQEAAEQISEAHQKSQFTPDTFPFGSVQTEQGNSNNGPVKDERMERPLSRVGFPASSNVSTTNQVTGAMSAHLDSGTQMPSGTPLHTGPAGKTAQKKTSAAQKKTSETLGSSPSSNNKKQKTSGAFQDQSIEHLNDVTAVSGVNIREEEEQLLSAPKEDSRASEATRRVAQEEEERLILQKGPLQTKLADITSKCGLETIGTDVERCISMCMEERMRGLISSLIPLSKQRVDLEKTRHGVSITSDVRHHILEVNKKAKEEWEKKQAEEAERSRKNNQTDTTTGPDADKDKDENRSKNLKANKEEDDKMRTTAANVAARAAVGGDDMLSKWQLMMAERNKQKHEGADGSSGGGSHPPSKLANRKPSTTTCKAAAAKEQREAGGRKGSPGSANAGGGPMRKSGKGMIARRHPLIARNISVRDVIAALEREPQMAKSTFIYRLYERLATGDTGVDQP